MIRNIIFDWSGTLVDDLPAVFAATNFVFERSGIKSMTMDEFRAEFCLPFTHFYDRFTPHVPLPQLEDWFHDHFRGAQDLVVDLPHAREFLQFCREQKIRMFVLSTIHREYYLIHTALNRFDEFIEKPYLAIRDKRAKIGEVLVENGLDPRETLFIGDMQHDIDTAKHGGIHSCAVLTGYNRLEQLRASEPDLIVEHLGELREILQRHRFELPCGQHGVEDATLAHPICTVGALIFNDANQVLMVRTQKWSGLWGIPGGKTKFGETSEAALRREIKEETGLEIEDIQFALVQDCIRSKEFYREAHFVLLNYTGRARGVAEVRLNEEAQEFRWVTLAQALCMDLNQPTRVLIEDVKRRGGE